MYQYLCLWEQTDECSLRDPWTHFSTRATIHTLYLCINDLNVSIFRLFDTTTVERWKRGGERNSHHQGQHQPQRLHRVRAWLQPGQGGQHPGPRLQGDGGAVRLWRQGVAYQVAGVWCLNYLLTSQQFASQQQVFLFDLPLLLPYYENLYWHKIFQSPVIIMTKCFRSGCAISLRRANSSQSTWSPALRRPSSVLGPWGSTFRTSSSRSPKAFLLVWCTAGTWWTSGELR